MTIEIPKITVPTATKPETKQPPKENTEPNIGTLLATTKEIKADNESKLDFAA